MLPQINSCKEIPEILIKGETIKFSKQFFLKNKVFLNGTPVEYTPQGFKVRGNLKIYCGKKEKHLKIINGFLTILPPLIAIGLALVFKETIISLFLGIYSGVLILNDYKVVSSFFRVIDTYIISALNDRDRLSIIVFSLMLGGMVGVITKNGGVKGIVESLAKKANSRKKAQLYTMLMGIFIFFDDYTNTLVVGNTMRPITDKLKISREKLAYIVDSTSAPVVSIALISTWIGFEVSLIAQSFKTYSIKLDAYTTFLQTIPLRFYSLFALFLVFLVALSERDFGPMLKAERRAKNGKLLRDGAVALSDFESQTLSPSPDIKPSAFNGFLPVFGVIITTIFGLYFSGIKNIKLNNQNFSPDLSLKTVGTIISSANSFDVLLWASFVGVSIAIVVSVLRGVLSLKESLTAWFTGMKSMLLAVVILTLAWTLGVVIVKLKTADFLVLSLKESISFRMVPFITFFLSALTSFATGTSWGTLSIMLPLSIPFIHKLLLGSSYHDKFLIFTVAMILTGSVFGDHCSPISDTTIMSSMASSSDHIDHVRTQLPYSLFVAATVSLFGIIPLSFGVPYWIVMPAVVFIFSGVFFLLSKKD